MDIRLSALFTSFEVIDEFSGCLTVITAIDPIITNARTVTTKAIFLDQVEFDFISS